MEDSKHFSPQEESMSESNKVFIDKKDSSVCISKDLFYKCKKNLNLKTGLDSSEKGLVIAYKKNN